VKLKLEAQDYGMILSVTESISAQEIPVLRAGLGKIFQTQKNPVLLDLSQLPDAQLRNPQTLTQLLALKASSAAEDHELFVITPVERLGDAGTRDQGIALIRTPLARFIALESTLQLEVAELERQKGVLEKKLQAIDSGAGSLRKLRKENSDLRKRLSFVEPQVRSLLTARREPLASDPMTARLKAVERTLGSVLESQGILQAGQP
jgi:hypothetical protein